MTLERYSTTYNHFEDFEFITTPNYNEVKGDIQWMLQLANNTSDRLKENYSDKNFFKDKILLYSIVYKNGDPYQMSTTIKRDCFNGGVRLGNRFFQNPYIRRDNLIGFDLRSMIGMINRQQQLVNAKYYFISRESTPNTLKLFCSWINKFTEFTWEYDKKIKFDVTGNGSYQYVVWSTLTDLDKPLLNYSFL